MTLTSLSVKNINIIYLDNKSSTKPHKQASY